VGKWGRRMEDLGERGLIVKYFEWKIGKRIERYKGNNVGGNGLWRR
jgi:hypothetical protein